jgi:hypothetical protein
MSGAITPLPQYAFMTWCSVRLKCLSATVVIVEFEAISDVEIWANEMKGDV